MALGASSTAASLRRFIRCELGGKCFTCGQARCLQFHLKVSDGGAHHRMGSLQRARFYLGQLVARNLELQCSDCHSAITVSTERNNAALRLRDTARCLHPLAGS